MERTIIPIRRACNARLVPTGTPTSIPEGTFVTLTQSLGGNYTVVFNGNMARIDAEDADALGFEPTIPSFPTSPDGRVDESTIWEALRSVYDPEIPVNIVDLGLIYECKLDSPDASGVTVVMTLTAPGCGMGPVLVEDIKQRLSKIPDLARIDVELVFDPPWSRDMMSEEAQLELGLF